MYRVLLLSSDLRLTQDPDAPSEPGTRHEDTFNHPLSRLYARPYPILGDIPTVSHIDVNPSALERPQQRPRMARIMRRALPAPKSLSRGDLIVILPTACFRPLSCDCLSIAQARYAPDAS